LSESGTLHLSCSTLYHAASAADAFPLPSLLPFLPQLENALTAMFQIAKTTTGPPRPTNASAAALSFLDCCLRVDPHDRPSASQLLQHPWIVAGKG